MNSHQYQDSLPRALQGEWPELSKRAEDPHSVADVSDLFSFAHGLTGVDQDGNYMWTYVLLGTFLSICAVAFFIRIVNSFHAHLRHMSAVTSPGMGKQNYWKHGNWYWMKIKKHLMEAPLWKNRHNRAWELFGGRVDMGTLPGRFHALLLALYLGSNIAYCVILPYHEEEISITIASLRGRTGTLACLNLIPTILFALRNNPLIWLLGVPYDTFNLLHRWAARIVVLESVAHTVAWFVNTWRAGKWEKVNDVIGNTPSYQWGMVGTVAFVSIFFTAWSPVRHAFYETFLNTHRLFVFLGLAGVYVHVDLHRLPQVPWMWLIIALWALEWAIRIFTIFHYKIGGKNTRIEVEPLPGDACRVTVHLARAWNYKPGCHAYIYIPTLALWSCHPFSIAWYHPNDEEHKDVESGGDRLSTHKIDFICKARKGMTKQLQKAAIKHTQKNGVKVWTTSGAIEGPYGGHDKLNSYGTVVLCAAGVGITHQVGYIHHLIKGYEDGVVACRKLLLVWSIPTMQCMSWIQPYMDQILKMKGRKDILQIQIFISRPGKHDVQNLNNGGSDRIRVHAGRCKMEVIMEDVMRTREGAVAVTVCGSGAFADGVRNATRGRMDQGVIDFIEEGFSY